MTDQHRTHEKRAASTHAVAALVNINQSLQIIDRRLAELRAERHAETMQLTQRIDRLDANITKLLERQHAEVMLVPAQVQDVARGQSDAIGEMQRELRQLRHAVRALARELGLERAVGQR